MVCVCVTVPVHRTKAISGRKNAVHNVLYLYTHLRCDRVQIHTREPHIEFFFFFFFLFFFSIQQKALIVSSLCIFCAHISIRSQFNSHSHRYHEGHRTTSVDACVRNDLALQTLELTVRAAKRLNDGEMVFRLAFLCHHAHESQTSCRLAGRDKQ